VIRELAENANTYTTLGPGEERIVGPSYVIWLGVGNDPHGTVVQRLRIRAADVNGTVEEIRGTVASRGRTACTWEVADPATPPDLVDRLLARGCVPDTEPLAVGMVLTEPPGGHDPPGISARRVESLVEYEESIRIANEAFGTPPEVASEILGRAPDRFAQRGIDSRTYLAFADGRAVARATASFTEHGVLLFGGATREDARGRGAYRALVRARWNDAVAAGVPVLVTHAGAMSRPILARLGFREISTIHILLDEFGRSG
jgi:hypothetical protein